MNLDILPALIVGAGPTGLTLAAQLERFGIAFRLIDRYPSPLILSKAAALHARTLETFEQLGVLAPFLDEGQRVDILMLRTFYQDRLRVDFSTLKDTRYPYMLDIGQYRTEQHLLDHLVGRGVRLDREVQLLHFADEGDHIAATVQHKDGTTETWRTRWLLGCDGVKSTVRDLAGLAFEGEPYADDWVLCDARLDWHLPRNEMTFSGDENGIMGIFPMPGENMYRVAYTQTRDANGAMVEPSLEDVQNNLRKVGIPGEVLAVDSKFWKFNLAHKQARHYRKGRVFLLGDAGHVHTPFGGQGLNLGVGDATNLAWKLALVEQGYADERLLDSYEVERHKVGKEVIRTTHLGASAMLMRGSRWAPLRDLAMTALDRAGVPARVMSTRLSQIGHTYRSTPAVMGKAGALMGGDRAPNQAFFDGLGQRYAYLWDVLSPAKHTLVLVASDVPRAQQALLLAKYQALAAYGHLLDVSIITTDPLAHARPFTERLWIDRGGDLRAYHHPGHITAYLVRPDQHLAAVQATLNWEQLETFLRHYYRHSRQLAPATTPTADVGEAVAR